MPVLFGQNLHGHIKVTVEYEGETFTVTEGEVVQVTLSREPVYPDRFDRGYLTRVEMPDEETITVTVRRDRQAWERVGS